MAQGQENIARFLGTVCAGEDLSDHQFRAVRYNMFERWQKGDAVNLSQGILTNTPLLGQAASVCVRGAIMAEVSGVVTAGRYLSVGADGVLFEDTDGTFAWAMGSGTDGSKILVYVLGSNPGSGGGGGSDDAQRLVVNTFFSDQGLPAFVVVRNNPTNGRVMRVNSDLEAHCSGIVGVNLVTVGAAGSSVQVLNQGRIQDASFSFNDAIDPTLFVNGNGFISQTPPTTGFVQIVGHVVTTDTIFVQLDQPVLLAA